MKKGLIIFNTLIAFSVGAIVQSSCGGVDTASAENPVIAAQVSFDNTETALQADNIQDALTEVAAMTGCVDPVTDIVGTWLGSSYEKAADSLDIVEETGVTWTFNADGTYTSNVAEYPSGKYKVVSCEMMVLSTSAEPNWKVTTQTFRVTPTSLAMALEDAGAETIPYVLTKQ
jgi:uncharacterized lipoprotein NlpE involved in copper resistance